MRDSITKITLLSLTLIFATFLFSGASEQYEKQISSKIAAANYCEKTEDCTIESFGCPFGSYSYVNKNEVSKIRDSMKTARYRSCKYDHDRIKFTERLPICEQNKCVKPTEQSKIYQNYSCEQIRPLLEIELGQMKFCTKDSDCITPKSPFECVISCNTVVSKLSYNEANKAMLEEFEKNCGYCSMKKCATPKKLGCVNSMCEVVE